MTANQEILPPNMLNSFLKKKGFSVDYEELDKIIRKRDHYKDSDFKASFLLENHMNTLVTTGSSRGLSKSTLTLPLDTTIYRNTVLV